MVADDVAADIVATLSGPGRLTTAEGSSRPIAPGDIAVLVGSARARRLRPGRLAGCRRSRRRRRPRRASSPRRPQHEWATLLRAMQRPRGTALRGRRAHRFLGTHPAGSRPRGDEVDQDVALRLREWASDPGAWQCGRDGGRDRAGDAVGRTSPVPPERRARPD